MSRELENRSTVAIIGAGPLGRWLALSAARAGFRVLLEDVMPANLHHAQELLRQQLSPEDSERNMNRAESEGALQTADKSGFVSGHDFSRAENAAKSTRALAPEETLETEGGGNFNPRIEFTTTSRALAPEGHVSYISTIEEAVRNADLVIDCVPDELESKLEILWLLDRMAPPRTVLATPTTRLSITDLANCTYRPAKCIAIAAEAAALTGKSEVGKSMSGAANPAASAANSQASSANPEILLRTTTQTAPETVLLLDHFWRQLGFTPVFAPDPAGQPSN